MLVKKYTAMLDGNGNPYLAEEPAKYHADGRKTLSTPKDAADFLITEMKADQYAGEHAVLLCLNTKNKLIGTTEISIGSHAIALFPTREIFQKALLIGAASVIVSHNHPSGDPVPSDTDIVSTEKLKKAGELIGVPVHDHIITALGGHWFSMHENGVVFDED